MRKRNRCVACRGLLPRFPALSYNAPAQMILRALEFCHSHWVVHRDIKPNNFLVTANGELKLVRGGCGEMGRDLGTQPPAGTRCSCLRADTWVLQHKCHHVGGCLAATPFGRSHVLMGCSATTHRNVTNPLCPFHPMQADFGLARMYGSPDRRYTNQASQRLGLPGAAPPQARTADLICATPGGRPMGQRAAAIAALRAPHHRGQPAT